MNIKFKLNSHHSVSVMDDDLGIIDYCTVKLPPHIIFTGELKQREPDDDGDIISYVSFQYEGRRIEADEYDFEIVEIINKEMLN